MTDEQTFEVRPIGWVERESDTDSREEPCIIRVRPEFQEALLGIEPGDRVQVMFWMSRLDEDARDILRCHPMGDRSRPKRGVFALRSPMRPNPMGSTVVDVQAVDGNRLTVTGLDALDGSPVVDMKIAT